MISGTLKEVYPILSEKYTTVYRTSVYNNKIYEMIVLSTENLNDTYHFLDYEDAVKSIEKQFYKDQAYQKKRIESDTIFQYYKKNKKIIDEYVDEKRNYILTFPFLDGGKLWKIFSYIGPKSRENVKSNTKRYRKYLDDGESAKKFKKPVFSPLSDFFETKKTVYYFPENGDILWETRVSSKNLSLESVEVKLTSFSLSSDDNHIGLYGHAKGLYLGNFQLNEDGSYDNNVSNVDCFMTKKEALKFLTENLKEKTKQLNKLKKS